MVGDQRYLRAGLSTATRIFTGKRWKTVSEPQDVVYKLILAILGLLVCPSLGSSIDCSVEPRPPLICTILKHVRFISDQPTLTPVTEPVYRTPTKAELLDIIHVDDSSDERKERELLRKAERQEELLKKMNKEIVKMEEDEEEATVDLGTNSENSVTLQNPVDMGDILIEDMLPYSPSATSNPERLPWRNDLVKSQLIGKMLSNYRDIMIDPKSWHS